MLEIYFEAAHTLARLRTGPTGSHVDDFAGSLEAAGYQRWTARGYLRAAAHLGLWMRTEGLEIEALDQAAVQAFGEHLPACRCLRRNRGVYGDAVAGARLFVHHLRDRGVLSIQPDPEEAALSELIDGFEHWMSRHRGVTDSTLEVYRRHLLALVAALGEAPDRYTAGDLRTFVSTRAAEHGRKRAKVVITSVRMFVRYLGSHGLCAPHLADALPGVANWKLSSLPAYLSPADVDRLLGSCDTCTPCGRRDRAILLLLVRLGLRASEVAALKGADVDWKAATIRVAGKSRRAIRLPLPQEVGDAILDYIEHGRPVSRDDHVFLRVRAPLRPITRHVVSAVVNAATARAGVEPPRGGAHVLRHTAATTLLRQGLPLSSVGTVLRHRSLESTAQYAKVDTAFLAQVAQPWPGEVVSC